MDKRKNQFANIPFLFQPFISACYKKLCDFFYLLLCLFCLNLVAFRERSCLQSANGTGQEVVEALHPILLQPLPNVLFPEPLPTHCSPRAIRTCSFALDPLRGQHEVPRVPHPWDEGHSHRFSSSPWRPSQTRWGA